MKSHEDLHKLWYVFLKEKNKLKSDLLLSQQLGQMFYGYSDLVKIRLSMARLLTVVNERKKLRNEYRKHLEDDYIAKKKAEEKAAIDAENAALREKGIKTPRTEEEVKEVLAKKAAKKKEALASALEQLTQAKENTETAKAPLLDESDI